MGNLGRSNLVLYFFDLASLPNRLITLRTILSDFAELPLDSCSALPLANMHFFPFVLNRPTCLVLI